MAGTCGVAMLGVAVVIIATSALAAPGAVQWHKNHAQVFDGAMLTALDVTVDVKGGRIVGYAVGYSGSLLKLNQSIADPVGGEHWRQLNVDWGSYVYGVSCSANGEKVLVNGFVDTPNHNYGYLRASLDGGNTWSHKSHTKNGTEAWIDGKSRFARDAGSNTFTSQGIVNMADGSVLKNKAGTDGFNPNDWEEVVANNGWLQGNFVLRPDGQALMTGVNFCQSKNSGANWTCGPPIDAVFDSGIDCAPVGPEQCICIVGGGSIEPTYNGWAHVRYGCSGDLSKHWGPRVLNASFPIREVYALRSGQLLAVGGGETGSAKHTAAKAEGAATGGVYVSYNLGLSWELSLTVDSMPACRVVPIPEHHGNGTVVAEPNGTTKMKAMRVYCIDQKSPTKHGVYSADFPMAL